MRMFSAKKSLGVASVLGILAGVALALAQPAQAAVGKHDCDGTHACEDGSDTCKVTCGETCKCEVTAS